LEDEYDFSDAEQGKFYRPIEELEGLQDKNVVDDIVDILLKKSLRIHEFKPLARKDIYRRS
jgi:hypothetical protein